MKLRDLLPGAAKKPGDRAEMVAAWNLWFARSIFGIPAVVAIICLLLLTPAVLWRVGAIEVSWPLAGPAAWAVSSPFLHTIAALGLAVAASALTVAWASIETSAIEALLLQRGCFALIADPPLDSVDGHHERRVFLLMRQGPKSQPHPNMLILPGGIVRDDSIRAPRYLREKIEDRLHLKVNIPLDALKAYTSRVAIPSESSGVAYVGLVYQGWLKNDEDYDKDPDPAVARWLTLEEILESDEVETLTKRIIQDVSNQFGDDG